MFIKLIFALMYFPLYFTLWTQLFLQTTFSKTPGLFLIASVLRFGSKLCSLFVCLAAEAWRHLR